MMNVGERLHGFRVTRVRELSEIGATMVEMVYEKNGAQLVYLDREEDNKTFAIAFKTIPEDDTGVFHIIEHSVLCGSEKYPTKDPFVELLKGSLQTFLNAFTFPDKTMYPVCSRNDRDFLNLVDVYMDAVLHPQILKKPEIFYQEGWHYEWDGKGEVSYKGVVFNEMKGAYSSVDGLVEEKMSSLLYPDNCYGKDSGGNPVHIPELTYEKFLACHAKYYHPSNARIFLDGKMPLSEVLSKLDGFLCAYEPLSLCADIPLQAPRGDVYAEDEYELGEGEDMEGKCRLTLGYMGFPYDAKREGVALSVISSVLCGSNEAPLKRALLSEGLCEDINFVQNDGIQQSSVEIDIRNIKEENIERIRDTVTAVLTEAAEGGLAPERMTAALNSLEFRLRERDFGRFPRGLVFAMASLESWLYGGDPAQNLCYDDTLAFLREHLTDGYFEDLIRRLFLENPHRATLLLRPSRTLAERRLADERRALAEARAAWSESDAQAVVKLNADLAVFQQQPDSPEAIATLPTLSLSDISPLPEKRPLTVETADGITVLRHDIATAGILYTNLYFSINDLTREELPVLSLLCHLFTNTATDERDTLALQDHIKTHLGYLSMTPQILTVGTDPTRARVYLDVAAGVLSGNRHMLPEILRETLLCSHPDDKEQIRNILRQIKMEQEEFMLSAGHQVGVGCAMADLTSAGVAAEYTRGVAFYEWVKETERTFDGCADALVDTLRTLLSRLIVRERVTVSVTGACDEAFVRSLIAFLPVAPSACKIPADSTLQPRGARRIGIRTPSQSSYAVAGCLVPAYTGTMAVAEGLLSYEYLWNKIRVQGGAYGAGIVVRKNGFAFLYSYRDPDANRSLTVFDTVPAFLKTFAEGEEPIEKYIIGAIGSSEPLMTPRVMGEAANTDYLREVTYEDACRVRREMLSTTREDLRALSDVLAASYEGRAVCVVGGKDKVDACEGCLDTVRDM